MGFNSAFKGLNTHRLYYKDKSVRIKKIITVCYNKQREHTNTFCVQNVEFFNVKGTDILCLT